MFNVPMSGRLYVAITPDVGTGLSIAFSSGFLAKIVSVSLTGVSREAHDTSTMSTTVARTFMPGDLYDPGELTVEMQWDTDAAVAAAITGVSETITITWPDAETCSASGFMTGFEITAELEQVMMATATMKLTGAITF